MSYEPAKAKLKSFVGHDLSYHRNYMKSKVFTFARAKLHIDEFAKHLFGSNSRCDKELCKTADALRFFSDDFYTELFAGMKTNSVTLFKKFLRRVQRVHFHEGAVLMIKFQHFNQLEKECGNQFTSCLIVLLKVKKFCEKAPLQEILILIYRTLMKIQTILKK
jgi:hypothetical protein